VGKETTGKKEGETRGGRRVSVYFQSGGREAFGKEWGGERTRI